jgi:hypothetical protein
MVERFPLRIHSCHRVFLQDLDLGAEFLPQNRFTGISFPEQYEHDLFANTTPKFEFIYNAVQLIFTWTSLANFFLAFFFVCCPFSKFYPKS